MGKGSRVVVVSGWFTKSHGVIEDTTPDGWVCVKLDYDAEFFGGWVVEQPPFNLELEERYDLWNNLI